MRYVSRERRLAPFLAKLLITHSEKVWVVDPAQTAAGTSGILADYSIAPEKNEMSGLLLLISLKA